MPRVSAMPSDRFRFHVCAESGKSRPSIARFAFRTSLDSGKLLSMTSTPCDNVSCFALFRRRFARQIQKKASNAIFAWHHDLKVMAWLRCGTWLRVNRARSH